MHLQRLTFLGDIYEERQLIIVPGEVDVTTAANSSDYHWSECNRGTAVHIFDTYDWEFKSEFDPDYKGSKVPPEVFYKIGGNETGGAERQQPRSGWDDKALGDIFSVRNQLPPDDPNTTSPTPPPNDPNTTLPTTPLSWDKTHRSNKNAIIGGTVGGVCVVVLIVGILIFLIKGCRKPESDRAELHGTGHRRHELHQIGSERVELHETSHSCFELYAYEPPELMSQ